MTTISGKFVLLTGASRGLGPRIARALAEHGAHLALAARSEEQLQSTRNNLSDFPVRTIAIPGDLTQPAYRQDLIAATLAAFGRLDILINNAGVETEGAYLDLSWEAIQENLEINLLAPMQLTYLALPHMLAQQQGHVVNIASIAAKAGTPYAATYCGAKAGLAEWTRGLRLEFAGSGIHFSTIFPGYVTEVGMFARFNKTPPPLVGFCTPAQVTAAVITAIQREQIERVVNSQPVRLLSMISELSPVLGDWLLKKIGAIDFQRNKTLP